MPCHTLTNESIRTFPIAFTITSSNEFKSSKIVTKTPPEVLKEKKNQNKVIK